VKTASLNALKIALSAGGFFMSSSFIYKTRDEKKPAEAGFFLKLILLRSSWSSSGWSSSSVRSSRSSSSWSSSVNWSWCWSWCWCSGFWSSYWSWGNGGGFFFFRASGQSNNGQQGSDQQGFFHGFSLVNSKLNTVLRLIITGNYRSIRSSSKAFVPKRCLPDNGNFLAEYYSDF
jgi:hypothetical protein